ncbi:MAG: biotin transporter BioY [Micrococcales bacterium]
MSLTLAIKPTIVDRVIKNSLASDIALVVAGTIFTAIAAQLYIPASPVPFTFQTLAVLLVGASLGSLRGALSMGLYAVVGGLGLPVFTEASSGMSVLFGATGGYIIGFIIAAALVGYLSEKNFSSNVLKMAVSYTAGTIVIYALGATWLTYGYLGGVWTGDQGGLAYGVLPFLIWDAVKAVVAAGLLPASWKLVNLIKGRK